MKKKPKKILRKIKYEFLLLIILFFALSLRLIFFTGVNTSDDAAYYNSAYDILTGEFRPSWLMTLRIMLLYPTAFFFWLFGINNFSAGLWPLFCSLGVIVMAYKIGEITFDKKIGLLAALLLTFFPLEVIYGTRLSPDVPNSFFMSVSIFLFLKGKKLVSSKSKIFYFVSGIALGLAYLVKALGALLFVFYVSYIFLDIIIRKKINWNYLLIFFGFLFLFCLEGLYYYQTNGDFLLRYHEMTGTYSATSGYWGKGIDPKDVLTFYPPAMLNLSDYYTFAPNTRIYGFFFYFVIIATIYLLIKKEKRSYILILWMLALFLYLQIGTRSISQYLLFGKEMRFLTIISVPCSIIVAAFLSQKNLMMRYFLPISIVFLFFTSVYYTYFLADHLDYGLGECGCMRMSDIRQIAEFIKNRKNSTFYVDEAVFDNIRFFLSYDIENLKVANFVKNEEEMKNSFIVLNSSLPLINSCKISRLDHPKPLPEFMCQPPKEWKLVKIIGGRYNNLEREYNPTIYYAP